MSEVRSAVEALRVVDLAAVSDSELLASVEDLLEVSGMLDAVIAHRLAAADRREATVAVCGRTVRGWLHEELRVSAVEAGRRVAVAKGLAFHPGSAAAFDAGDIGFDHARVISSCLTALPTSVHDHAEQVLVEAARSLPADELRPAVDTLREVYVDETLAEREQRRYDSRWATTSTTFAGMLHLEAMLDPESGHTLLTAVNALMGVRSDTDDRTTDQRRADAVVDLARQSLTAGTLPDHNGDRPHLTVTIDWNTLHTDLTRNGADSDHTTAGPGASAGPSAGVGGTLTGLTGVGVPITVETARRIACDAQIIPAVLGGDGQVLDLGRTSATWTVHQRRAAALRDHGCAFTGCRAGLDRCQLHHIAHWVAHHGPTNIDNSAYLCHFHHWLVHHRHWTISRDRSTKKIQVLRT